MQRSFFGLEIRCSICLSYAPSSAHFILSAVGVVQVRLEYVPINGWEPPGAYEDNQTGMANDGKPSSSGGCILAKQGGLAVSMRLQRSVRGEPSGVSDSVRTISSLGPVGIVPQRTIGVPKCLNLPRYTIDFHLILFQETLKRWGSGYPRRRMHSGTQFSRGGTRIVHVRGYESCNVQMADAC
jgi:hypothetical protein